jgi:hypothetical protein
MAEVLGDFGPEITSENLNKLKKGKSYAVIDLATFPYPNIQTIDLHTNEFDTIEQMNTFIGLIKNTSIYEFIHKSDAWGGFCVFDKQPVINDVEYKTIRFHEIYSSNPANNLARRYRIFPIFDSFDIERIPANLLGVGIKNRKKSYRKKSYRKKSYRKKPYRKKPYPL